MRNEPIKSHEQLALIIIIRVRKRELRDTKAKFQGQLIPARTTKVQKGETSRYVFTNNSQQMALSRPKSEIIKSTRMLSDD